MGGWMDKWIDVEFSFLKIFSTNEVSCIECVVWEYFVTEMLCAGLGYSSIGRTLTSYVQAPSPSPLSTKRKEKVGFFCFLNTHNIYCRNIKAALVSMFHI